MEAKARSFDFNVFLNSKNFQQTDKINFTGLHSKKEKERESLGFAKGEVNGTVQVAFVIFQVSTNLAAQLSTLVRYPTSYYQYPAKFQICPLKL